MALHDRGYMGGVAPGPGEEGHRSGCSWTALRFLLLINVVVFLAWVFGASGFLMRHFLLSPENLTQGRVWTLLTASFFHVDLIHLATTLLFLYWCGKAVQDECGGLTVWVTYLAGGLACAALMLVWPIQPPKLPPGQLTPFAPASGTGFYVSERLVLTNAHVVGKHEQVVVQTATGQVAGRVIKKEQKLDLALVQVETPGKALPLCEESIRSGRSVFAYGYGVLAGENTTLLLTRGTISALRKDRQRIVFDAKVNPGNSGGPLVDADGRWVGVVVAKSAVGNGLDSLSLAVDGADAGRWVEASGKTVVRATGTPKGDVPPDAMRASVVRILSGAPLAMQGQAPPLTWFDHRVFGASGGVFALAFFCLFRRPRRTVFSGVYPIPLFVLVIFFGLADLTGSLRVHATPGAGLEHSFHIAGGLIGFLFQYFRIERPLRRFRSWLRQGLRRRIRRAVRGKPPELKVLEGGKGRIVELSDGSGRLDPDTEQKMDDILRLIASEGIEALTPEQKAFLESTSDRLKD